MFFIEYTEGRERKALNLAHCRTIETIRHQTSSRDTFSLKIELSSDHRTSTVTFDFKTEEQLDKAFDSLMTTIQESETYYWKIPLADE